MNDFSVMTFNVRGAYHADGVNSWPERSDLSARTLLRSAPDLIALQEVHAPNFEFFQERLARYSAMLGPHYGNAAPFEYLPVFWKPEVLRLVEHGGLWLSPTPEVHALAWDAACVRAVLWARFVVAATGGTCLLVNTHLDHIGAQARLEGARLIARSVARVARPDEPIVLAGDFNCPPGSAPYAALLGEGFVDTFTAAGRSGAEQTFHGFAGPDYTTTDIDDDRIDWILLRDLHQRLRPTAYTLIRDAEPPRYPSDHYPVLVQFAAP